MHSLFQYAVFGVHVPRDRFEQFLPSWVDRCRRFISDLAIDAWKSPCLEAGAQMAAIQLGRAF